MSRFAGAVRDKARDAFAHPGQTIVQRIALHRDDIMQTIAGLGQAHREIFAARKDCVGNPRAGGVDPLGKGVAANFQIGGESLPVGLKSFVQFRQAIGKRPRDAIARPRETGRGVLSSLGQPLDEIIPMRRQLIDEIVPAAVERRFDFLAFGVKRSGDTAGGFSNTFRETRRGPS